MSDSQHHNSSIVRDIADHLAKQGGFEVITVTDPNSATKAPVAVLPAGKTLSALDPFLKPFRKEPARRAGTAKVRNIASFVAHVNDFKDAHSAIFADPNPEGPKLVAVYDYNEKGGIGTAKPRFGGHRAEYACELSDQWNAWQEKQEEGMSQAEFAEFLEDRIEDVALIDGPHITEIAELLQARVGGPTALMNLARGLKVTVNATVHNAVTLASGEVQLVYTEQHSDGSGPITTPNLFFLNIPVFTGGDAYQVGMRLRYRLTGGRITWSYSLYRVDRVFDHAFKGLVETVRAQCDVRVYMGEPEPAAA